MQYYASLGCFWWVHQHLLFKPSQFSPSSTGDQDSFSLAPCTFGLLLITLVPDLGLVPWLWLWLVCWLPCLVPIVLLLILGYSWLCLCLVLQILAILLIRSTGYSWLHFCLNPWKLCPVPVLLSWWGHMTPTLNTPCCLACIRQIATTCQYVSVTPCLKPTWHVTAP